MEFKYSLAGNASNEVDRVLQDIYYDNEVLLRNETPSIIASQPGVKNFPMVMNAHHIRTNILTEAEARNIGLSITEKDHYHGLGKQLFLDIVDNLDNATTAYRGTKNAENPERRENYFLIISTLKDSNGKSIIVPIYVNQSGNVNNVFIDVNKISTVFGKNNFRKFINDQVTNKNLVRIKDKSVKASEKTPPIGAPYNNHTSIKEQDTTTDAESQGQNSTKDAEYLAAVEQGDTETAQKMVDTAA